MHFPVLFTWNAVKVITNVRNKCLHQVSVEFIKNSYFEGGKLNFELSKQFCGYLLEVLLSTELSRVARTAFYCLRQIIRTLKTSSEVEKMINEGTLIRAVEKWENCGMNDELEGFISVYETNVVLDRRMKRFSNLAREEEAAICIQAAWRGQKCRKDLAKLIKIMNLVKRTFRNKIERIGRLHQNQEMGNINALDRSLREISVSRDFKERSYSQIQQISAKNLKEYKARTRFEAAVVIQKWWRRYSERNQVESKLLLQKKIKAACTIQRAFRAWRNSSRRKNEFYNRWIRTEKVDPETHQRILETLSYRKTYSGTPNRDNSMGLLVDYINRRQEQNRKINDFEELMTSIELIKKQITEAPSLSQSEIMNMGGYTSSLKSIRETALSQHKRELMNIKTTFKREIDNLFEL